MTRPILAARCVVKERVECILDFDDRRQLLKHALEAYPELTIREAIAMFEFAGW
jgi:hypothetical protein